MCLWKLWSFPQWGSLKKVWRNFHQQWWMARCLKAEFVVLVCSNPSILFSYLHNKLCSALCLLCFPLISLFQRFLLLKYFSSICYLGNWCFICCLYFRIFFSIATLSSFPQIFHVFSKTVLHTWDTLLLHPRSFFSFVFFLKAHLYLIL